jgi:hypothetical protein
MRRFLVIPAFCDVKRKDPMSTQHRAALKAAREALREIGTALALPWTIFRNPFRGDWTKIYERPCAMLENKKVVPCGEFRHSRWLRSDPDRRVAFDTVGEYEIITVFLTSGHHMTSASLGEVIP